ncbi:MAG TPA: TonB-dependent receptor [Draconibacterium sp.]|nr:TonB-dependent receptor [Draconibacterium sp.]
MKKKERRIRLCGSLTRTLKLTGLLLFLQVICSFTNVSAQSTIRGQITDGNEQALPGVTVIVKGTTQGGVSDFDGNYTVTDVPSGATLVFSFVGMQDQEIVVGNQSVINVTMVEETIGLEEVVAIGYGTQSKRNISGSISSVESEEIVRSTSTSLSGALAGKVQGVTTRATDSRPGNGVNLQIRNMGSPLYVIDGIPYGGVTGNDWFGLSQGSGENVFNSLSLEDIESISILKDASAAIYGLRAANGVVLVTTKNGNKNENVKVNVNSYYGMQNFTRYPQPADAYQYIRASLESEQNYDRNPANLYSPEELAKWKDGTEKGYKSYDYLDIVTRNNVPQYYANANVSGGTQRSSYYFSVAHTGQEAIIKDYNYDRTNVQANLEANLVSGLTVGTQISAILENTHNVGVPGLDDYFNPLLSVFTMWPIESPYANDNPDYVHQTHNVNVNPATYKDDITGWVDLVKRTTNVNLYAKYDFKFGLSIKGTYSYNYRNDDFDGFEYTYEAYKYDEATDTYYTQPGWGNQNPWREKHKRNVVNRFQQIQASYNGKFDDHSISAVFAYERSDYDNTYFVVHTVPSNNYIKRMYLAEQDYLNDSWTYQARAGYIGRINYNYKGKYIVEALGRYDGSYLYAPDSRFGFFPGMTLAWRISDEDFFSPLSGLISDLKLRASYGITGSESGVGAFDFMGGFNYGSGNSIFDGEFVNGIVPRGLPITGLSWVKNKSTNLGFDVAFLDNKLTASFDAFERRRTGLPASRYDVKLPSEVGYGLPNENLESDAHRGLEGIVSYKDKVGDLEYRIGANATYARRRWLESYKPRFGNSWDEYRSSSEDRWTDIFWGYQVIGRFESVEDIQSYAINNDGANNTQMLPGDFKYKDVNGDGIINGMDERPIGYARGAQPYFSYGLNAGFNWKRWSLTADFAGAGQQTFVRNWELKFPFQNNGSAPDYMFEDRWHQADPYDANSEWVSGEYPAIRKGLSGGHANNRNNDFWSQNIHYFRMKNLEIGYEVPANVISKVGLERLRIYANGSNLFSLDNVSKWGIDPEIASANGLAYPLQKLYIIGFNLTF